MMLMLMMMMMMSMIMMTIKMMLIPIPMRMLMLPMKMMTMTMNMMMKKKKKDKKKRRKNNNMMCECTHSLGAQSVACASKIYMGVDCAYRAIRHLADWRLCCVHRTHTQPSALCSLYSSKTSHASASLLSLLVICNAYDRFTFLVDIGC
jgi:hypothetical protein